MIKFKLFITEDGKLKQVEKEFNNFSEYLEYVFNNKIKRNKISPLTLDFSDFFNNVWFKESSSTKDISEKINNIDKKIEQEKQQKEKREKEKVELKEHIKTLQKMKENTESNEILKEIDDLVKELEEKIKD